MKSAVLLLAVLVLIGCATASIDGSGRSLSGRRRKSADCSAVSKLKIRVKSGKCWGTAEADCSAYASAVSQVRKDIRDWFATKRCQRGALEAYAGAHAKALANVLVTAQVHVRCEGVGYACGYSVAKGSALAEGFALAQANAFVDADPNAEHAGTFCEGDVEALGDVYAEVLEKVRAHACQRGWGQKWQLVQRFEESVKCAIATAYVRAEAQYCTKKGWGNYQDAKAWSKCTGRGEVLWLCRGF